MSEKALRLLSQPFFKKGLIAGLPANIPIAKKFGERSFSAAPADPTSQKELHDCGIIYYPSHPYLLCVMTKGNNFDRLADTIKDISQTVYASVDNEYK